MHKENKRYGNRSAQDIDILMPMYNLIEYSGNDSKSLEVYGSTTKMSQIIT